jgi:magnesium-transporting ATPase (P-type)
LWCEMHICMSVVKYFVYPLLSTDAIQYLKKVLTSTRTTLVEYSLILVFWLTDYQLVNDFLDWQMLDLTPNKAEISARAHSVIDKFAERGLRSLGVARQASTLDAPCCSQPNED